MLDVKNMKKIICRRVFVSIISFLMILPVGLPAQTIDGSLANWSKYTGKSAFTIMVPPTVELKKPEDAFTQEQRRLNICNDEGAIVFQQKGLSCFERTALEKYCRILINYFRGDYGEYLKSTEVEMIDDDVMCALDQLVASNTRPAARLMGKYSCKWVTINGAKCLQIDYRRTGGKFDVSIPVICRMAIFQNDNEMVIMTLAYREKEADLWKTDLEKVFKSFRRI